MFVEKVEGTLMTYTNELEVEVDFSDVDPSLLEESEDDTDSTVALSTSDDNSDQSNSEINSTDTNDPIHKMEILDQVVKSKSAVGGRAARFFRKRLNKR
jgi:hypothetical protein